MSIYVRSRSTRNAFIKKYTDKTNHFLKDFYKIPLKQSVLSLYAIYITLIDNKVSIPQSFSDYVFKTSLIGC